MGNYINLTGGLTSEQIRDVQGVTFPPSGSSLASTQSEAPRLVAWDTGSAVYVRMAWDATYDLVVKMVRNSGTPNANLNFQELGLLLKTTASTGTPTLTIIETFSDDTTGYLTAANGRIGGNHCAETILLTKAGHGRTAADIGKRYDDAVSREYVITRYIDANTLEIVPEPALSVLDPTGTKTLPSTSSLTGLDGLPSLTGCTYAYHTAGPGVNGLVQYVYLDDRPLVPYAPAQSGERLRVTEYHQAPNLKGAFTYFNTTGASATWANAGKMWDRQTTTTFYPWGQIEVEDSALLAYETRFTEANPLQFNPLLGLTGATNMHVWIPGADTITASGATINGVSSPSLNFNVPTYVGGTCSGSDVQLETSGDSILAGGVFPDFLVQLTSASSSSHSGWTVGHLAALDPTYAGGVPATRSTTTKEWFRLSPSSRKTYAPQLMSKDSTFAAATSFQHRAMRRWTPAVTGLDFWTFVKAGEKWLVYAAWTTNPGAFTLTLPGYLSNLTATAVRVHNSELTSTTSAGGVLTITPSAANGHAIIKLG